MQRCQTQTRSYVARAAPSAHPAAAATTVKIVGRIDWVGIGRRSHPTRLSLRMSEYQRHSEQSRQQIVKAGRAWRWPCAACGVRAAADSSAPTALGEGDANRDPPADHDAPKVEAVKFNRSNDLSPGNDSRITPPSVRGTAARESTSKLGTLKPGGGDGDLRDDWDTNPGGGAVRGTKAGLLGPQRGRRCGRPRAPLRPRGAGEGEKGHRAREAPGDHENQRG